MADLGGYEGVRQAPLPGLPDLPGRPIRRSGVEVPPAPSAVRCGGAPYARSSTRTLPKVNPCAGLGARV